ncbi:VWA domain-containing protein [Deinococcus humi]|uniref:Stress response protein SCP2 n=1 Tax=Deinococcus humi TaxID=662880 RepID=A0A7W8JRG1_9DEIO|nr:VWA domain-containing protein [Deinococcus humi]MBB5361493.1 stress response protein SCP2 [Deinococcus humi]GGO20352.1 tellurium resistance protein [Deinococcus humi]
MAGPTVLQAGQRVPLTGLGLGQPFSVEIHCTLDGADIAAFGLQDGKLADDRYMVFFNQPRSPEGALELARQGVDTVFNVNLAALPAAVTELYFTATHDSQPIAGAGALSVRLGQATFDVKPHLKAEKAVMLVRLYRHADGWRLATVAQGFNGGLDALVRHFGGEVEEAGASTPTPPPTAVNLRKERQRVLLEKAERQQPQLVSLIKTASVSLEKRGLAEARYRVKLVLDISGSMQREYRSGAVQALAERALALAARLDDDGEVEVYLFGIGAYRSGTLSLDNVSGFVDRLKVKLEGGTHYSPVMKLIREDAARGGHDLPCLVLFITDGGTSNPAVVVRQMTDAAQEPIFWKFMGIEEGRVNFDFLEKLDDLPGRVVDNADFFRVPAPIRIPDAELFELLLNELDGWQRDARAAGILRA